MFNVASGDTLAVLHIENNFTVKKNLQRLQVCLESFVDKVAKHCSDEFRSV